MLAAIETVFDTFMQLLVFYLAYRFYVIYRVTKDRIPLMLFFAFFIFAIVHLPYLIWHHFLGLPFAYSELLHEFLFALTAFLLAWAVFPRAGFKERLKEEAKKKGEAA